MEAQKQKQLIEMVSKFSDEYLDDEFKALNIKLVEKLGRKREVPFKRGKLENWAGGIVYAIGQLNFLFDDSFMPYVAPDEICDYFGIKKSTASNKARDIRKLLNLKLGDEEFSTEIVLECDVSRLGGDLSQVKTLEGAQRYSMLRQMGDMMRVIDSQNPNEDLEEFICELNTSSKMYIEGGDLAILSDLVIRTTFIAPTSEGKIPYLFDAYGSLAVPVFTSMEKYNFGDEYNAKKWKFSKLALLFGDDALKGIIVNPGCGDLFLSKEMVKYIIFGEYVRG